MEQSIEDLNFKFIPEQELFDFAKQFSENYRTLTVGEYFSNDRKYQIKYLERIIDKNSGRKLNTGARISHTTGIIEIDKLIFESEQYTSDYLFFIILWCVVEKMKRNPRLSDKITVEYYLTTGRSKKNLLIGYAKLFSSVMTELNVDRYKLLLEMLEEKSA